MIANELDHRALRTTPSVAAPAGWSRLSPRDEVAASDRGLAAMAAGEGLYATPPSPSIRSMPSIATGTDRTNLVKIGGPVDASFRQRCRSQHQRRMGAVVRHAIPASSPA